MLLLLLLIDVGTSTSTACSVVVGTTRDGQRLFLIVIIIIECGNLQQSNDTRPRSRLRPNLLLRLVRLR